MTIDTQKLRERIDAAIKRITSGSAPMRVPADQTDPDLVLADAKIALDAQAAEIARLKVAQTWQPIDTAPQGQIALFYDANATEVRGCMFVDWMVDGVFCGNRHHVATHWMPLPAGPDALQETSHDR